MAQPKSNSKQPETPASGLSAEALLQALPHPLLVIGPDNKIIFANASAEVFLGASEYMLKKRALPKILAFTSPLIALIEQVRQKGSTINEYKVDLSMQDQPPRAVDVFASLLPDAGDFILLMLQPRSMANLMERQLTHREAARSVSAMAAVLAHEIKNPLSGIRGAAQLLEVGASAEDKPLAHLITRETDRIRNLVDRMEVFGDQRPMKKEAVNIHAVLDHVKQIALAGFGRHVSFIEAYDTSLPDVPGNADKLIQVFLNLVKNAAEALDGKQDGQITLSTAFKAGLRMSTGASDVRVGLPIEICVSDNGPGVPEQIRPYLFDPFVTTKMQGAGLGLALVAKIVGDHGGVIECEHKSRLTTFRTLLPRQQTSHPKHGEC